MEIYTYYSHRFLSSDFPCVERNHAIVSRLYTGEKYLEIGKYLFGGY